LRILRILSAEQEPMPGTRWSSAEIAVFRLPEWSGGFFLAAENAGGEGCERREIEQETAVATGTRLPVAAMMPYGPT